MTDIEHLIENVLVAELSDFNDYQQLKDDFADKWHNKEMLKESNITVDELFEIAQYILYSFLTPEERENKKKEFYYD